MYKCRFFEIHELVSPELFEALGEEKCWELIPDIAKLQLDQIRDEYHSMYGKGIKICDWGFGGEYKYSGVRPLNCTEGASKSRHKLWIAFDLKPADLKDIEELHGFIKTMAHNWNISRIENFEHTPRWVHLEFGIDTYIDKPYWFNP